MRLASVRHWIRKSCIYFPILMFPSPLMPVHLQSLPAAAGEALHACGDYIVWKWRPTGAKWDADAGDLLPPQFVVLSLWPSQWQSKIPWFWSTGREVERWRWESSKGPRMKKFLTTSQEIWSLPRSTLRRRCQLRSGLKLWPSTWQAKKLAPSQLPLSSASSAYITHSKEPTFQGFLPFLHCQIHSLHRLVHENQASPLQHLHSSGRVTWEGLTTGNRCAEEGFGSFILLFARAGHREQGPHRYGVACKW